MDKIQWLVIVFAVLAMIKAVWILATPTGFKAFVRVWLRSVQRLTTLLPIFLAVIGIGIWALILFGQPVYVMLAALFGAFFLLAAFLYARPPALNRWAKSMVLDRSPIALRLMAGVILAVAVLMLWTAFAGK